MDQDDATPVMSAGLNEAARLHGVHDLRLGVEPQASPGSGEVLLRVRAVGICGSDLHWWEEASIGDAAIDSPLVLGHEFAGEIVGGSRTGERVVGDPSDPCGQCVPCLRGAVNLCLRMRFAGHGATDGALRTWMPWPSRLLVPIPDTVADHEAPLLEPAAIALHAVALAAAHAGPVGVFGCGPIGLLLVHLLREAGLGPVYATDVLPHRVAAAGAFGATAILAQAADGGTGLSGVPPLEVAFEVAGTDAALADALAAVAPGGKVVLVGIPPGDRTTFPAGLARRKGLSLVLCRRSRPEDLAAAVALAAHNRLPLGSLVTDRFPLARAREAFERATARSGLKVIVEP